MARRRCFGNPGHDTDMAVQSPDVRCRGEMQTSITSDLRLAALGAKRPLIRASRSDEEKLYSDFNDIRVRSFILNGAPSASPEASATLRSSPKNRCKTSIFDPFASVLFRLGDRTNASSFLTPPVAPANRKRSPTSCRMAEGYICLLKRAARGFGAMRSGSTGSRSWLRLALIDGRRLPANPMCG